MTEEPLRGAGLADRGLVRVGDTVRRPAGPGTPSVHHLLRSLDLDVVPRPLGLDAAGREVLSYLPGHDSGGPLRADIRTDDGAFRLGRLARTLREALRRYECPADARWAAGSGRPGPGQAVQHGDLGPWNLLWDDDGEVSGVLDWDFAGPADPWYDTGHLAWFTVPAMDDERARARGFPVPPDRRARLAAFADGTGTDVDTLVRAIRDSQREYADRVLTRGVSRVDGPWADLLARGFDAYARADLAWTRRWSVGI